MFKVRDELAFLSASASQVEKSNELQLGSLASVGTEPLDGINQSTVVLVNLGKSKSN